MLTLYTAHTSFTYMRHFDKKLQTYTNFGMYMLRLICEIAQFMNRAPLMPSY